MKLHFSDDFFSPAMPQKLFKNLQLKQFEILLLAAYKVIIDKSRGEVSLLEQDTIENVS